MLKVLALSLFVFLLLTPTYSAFSQSNYRIMLPDEQTRFPTMDTLAVPETEECSPPGSIRIGNDGNPLQGCRRTDGDSYNIIDLVRDIYDGTVKGAQCTGIILGTATVCAIDVVLINDCFNPNNHDEGVGEVCFEDETGSSTCQSGSIPSWLIDCGLSLPTTKLCVEVAKKVDNYCS